jgi:hypothetical protein
MADSLQRIIASDNGQVRPYSDGALLDEGILENRPADVIRLFKKLPKKWKTQHFALWRYVIAATMISNEDHFAEFSRAVAEYEKYFPKRDSFALKKVDMYILKKDWPKALAAIDSLDAAVGGDPWLNTLRESIRSASGNLEEAKGAPQHFAK